MRKIDTINSNDIIEQDDGSVTFSAGATKVQKNRQPDGKWTVVATFPDDNGTEKRRIKQAPQRTPAQS